MKESYSITEYFGRNLAELLSEKITSVYEPFDETGFVEAIDSSVAGKTYTQRIEFFADQLHAFIPLEYPESIKLLISILGDENPNETGMFKHFYWVMPVGKFIEKYGTHDFEVSMNAIGEVTKRNTGEYAVRPFIRKYPDKSLALMREWAQSDNFHLRRLASEGLRPKLPWASRLDTFLENPHPVLDILDLLKEDTVTFVKKSVANHLTDWLKVNPRPAREMINKWRPSDNIHTQWIIKRATRKIQ